MSHVSKPEDAMLMDDYLQLEQSLGVAFEEPEAAVPYCPIFIGACRADRRDIVRVETVAPIRDNQYDVVAVVLQHDLETLRFGSSMPRDIGAKLADDGFDIVDILVRRVVMR